MDLKQLKTFVTISRLNSFTKAANQLGYAQSSVTSQIQLLEQELEVRLFERFGRNISLTPEGKGFLTYANQMLNLWENVKGLAFDSGTVKGTLTIGAVESICALKLPRLLKVFNEAYSDVDLVLKIVSSSELLMLLRENQIDVAIALDQKISADEFEIKFQRNESLALLVCPNHPLAKKESVYPSDLSGYPLLLTRQGCFFRAMFESVLKDANIKSKITLETSNIQTVKQLAMFDFGITLLPKYAVEEEINNNQLLELPWRGTEFNIMLQVICHKDKWLSAPLKAFLSIVDATEF